MLLGMVLFLFTVSGGTLWDLCGGGKGEPGEKKEKGRKIEEKKAEKRGGGVCEGGEKENIFLSEGETTGGGAFFGGEGGISRGG
ncbi:hypothetical protein, partial [Escherichia coli]|uniref:hypothetical protein n=1 Tax=Escherichia coli TaxID=562 RepID=UPI000B7CBF50